MHQISTPRFDLPKFNSTSLRNDKEEEGDIGSHLEGHQASVQLLALVDLSNEEIAVASVHLCVRDYPG